MKSSFMRLLALTALLCLALGLTACGEDPLPVVPTTTTPSTTTEAPTTTTAPELPRDPLTGVKDFDTDNNRPVAFAVPDESADIVQVGIEHADMYFEAETEAGIPRMLAIFSSVDHLPDRVGPVRSARPHFIKYVDALDAIYCHIGGSGDARQAIRDQNINDVESASVQDETLAAAVKAGKNYSWNNKAFAKDKVLGVIQRIGYKTTTNTDSPFAFGEKEGTDKADSVNVKISYSYNIGFSYDEDTGHYNKHRVTMKGTDAAMDMPVHKSGSGGTVSVKNVIVMFDKRTVLDYKKGSAYHIDFELKSGSGLLACDGKAREITWKRTNQQLSFFEADGKTPLQMAEGKTFVCLTDKNLKSKTIVE